MCSHKMAAQLYDQLKVVCENHVKANIHQFLKYPLHASYIVKAAPPFSGFPRFVVIFTD